MIDFLKFRWLYFLISIIVIGAGFFSMAKWGFKYSIEFVGGTNLEYSTNSLLKINDIKQIFVANKIDVIEFEYKNKLLKVRTKAIDEKVEFRLKNDIESKLKTKLTVLKSETVGPVIGQETIIKTMIASILATIGILIYMSFAFKGINYALAAILAMIHDLAVVVGSYALLSHFFGGEVDIMFVTAVLTSMSFSIHDTIVIFDKIREYKNLGESENIIHGSNRALTETMVRSLNNSMTIVFMLLALTIFGGTTIRFFVATLLIGTITGTYSSPFVATPILVWLESWKNKK